MAAAELPLFYYLHNFHRVLRWVQQYSADLLEAEQVACGHVFWGLTGPAQALLVRLVMRKGSLFRVSKLRYPEIADICAATQELAQAGLVCLAPPLDLDDVFHLHTLAQLRAMFAPLPAGARKHECRAQVALRHGDQLRPCADWPGLAAEQSDVLRLSESVTAWAQRLQLLFFGNQYQDWSEFVLSDLGLYRYETLMLDAASRAFRHLDDVRLYETLSGLREAPDVPDRAQWQARLQAVCAIVTDSDWLQRRRDKTLFSLGQEAERQAWWELADQAYCRSTWPGARQRRVRVLERQQNGPDAWSLFCQAWERPESEAEVQKLARMLPRLRKLAPKARWPEQPVSLERAQARTQLSRLVLPDDGQRVEWQVMAHWHTELAPVQYVENTLLPGLLGLLCWEAIFAPLPGAFFHPYQSSPADWSSPDFVARRRPLFDQALALLDGPGYKECIRARWRDKQGMQCPLLFWPALGENTLELALRCIPPQHLHAIFRRVLQDWRDNRAGLPDLIRFLPAQNWYELIEVKGPGDRLQDNQRRWLSYFEQQGIPARVCHVSREPLA
ncbi:MAG TPA: VRR-NUC domain-containing protein [Alcaligenes sp.]|nr:VRR-NUC domain-containing protein [Alcaligenes sp.]HRL27364.1 VRR-NUC domain-containing protein [Alcaligenes sp.]